MNEQKSSVVYSYTIKRDPVRCEMEKIFMLINAKIH